MDELMKPIMILWAFAKRIFYYIRRALAVDQRLDQIERNQARAAAQIAELLLASREYDFNIDVEDARPYLADVDYDVAHLMQRIRYIYRNHSDIFADKKGYFAVVDLDIGLKAGHRGTAVEKSVKPV